MKRNALVAIAAVICLLAASVAIVTLVTGDKKDPLDELPKGYEDIDVIVNEGGKWELNGKITASLSGKSDIAVVIVQGSGPHDMDGTIGANKVYRDLAWGLAQNGIDVLRCDKRTFVYGGQSADDPKKLTVKEEAIDDAVAAAELLKDLGYKKIFLIGHSLGAMLAPEIVAENKTLFDGFISLAGSPRTLIEITVDQLRASANLITSFQIEQYIKAELAKCDQLNSWPESKLLSEMIFQILPAWYVKDLINRDAGKAAISLDVPMLFLQGSADFQVYAKKDFVMWQDILEGKEGVEFKLYDGLNHLFMASEGPDAGTVKEYDTKRHMSQDVIKDIAAFMNEI